MSEMPIDRFQLLQIARSPYPDGADPSPPFRRPPPITLTIDLMDWSIIQVEAFGLVKFPDLRTTFRLVSPDSQAADG